MQQLWSVIAITGLTTLLVNILPDVILSLKLASPAHSVFGNGYHLVRYYILISYLMLSFFMVRKLIFVKPNRITQRTWKAFSIFLLISLWWNINNFSYPQLFDYLFYGIGIALVSLLFVRIKWIALLNIKVKRQTIALLVVINLVNLALFENYFNSTGSNPFNLIATSQIFLFFIAGFVALYSMHSIFALIFNMPIASVADERNAEIESLKQLGQVLEKKLDAEGIFNIFFEHSFTHAQANAGWMIIHQPNGERHIACRNFAEKQGRHIALNLNDKLNQLEDQSHPYTLTRKKHESLFALIDEQYLSMLVYPIIQDEEELARVFLLKTLENGFDEYNINQVKTFARQAHIAFHNKQMLDVTLANERFEEELAIAERIQTSLIPSAFPQADYCDIWAENQAAKKVGGDFYDYHVIDRDRMIVVMGDVSGSGIPAALHMAEMKGIFQSLIQFDLTTVDFLTNANRAVSSCFEKQVFVALNYLFIDNTSKTVTYARAGNCPMLYFDAESQGARYLADEGLGLGILRSENFNDHVYIYEQTFQTNDLLLLYTDGVIEATQEESDEQYGMERLKNIFSKQTNVPVEKIVTNLQNDLATFTKTMNPNDDVAIMAIRFK